MLFIWLSLIPLFGMVYHFLGYPLLLFLMDKKCDKKQKVNKSFLIPLSIVVTAHNEEQVIESKIKNLLNLDYPKEMLKIIIVDDWSNDNTDKIIKKFKNYGITYLRPDKHLGKTYSQNFAYDFCDGELLVFSDANSIWNKNTLKNLVSLFNNNEVGFVAGKLIYKQKNELSSSGKNENIYWNYELKIRKKESDIKSILTSNGSIYAIRKNLFKKIDPLYSHDSYFPPYIVSRGKKALFCENAIGYEEGVKESSKEFRRKKRMFGRIYSLMFNKEFRSYLKIKNIGFKYKWMFFSHRILRFLNPLLLFVFIVAFSIGVIFLNFYIFLILFALFVVFIVVPNKVGKFLKYFVMTIFAMFLGFVNYIEGDLKPFWNPRGGE